jgi:hypothetical protein
MSVQSLQNGSLQLRELTVSNAYDSLATGYVAESTTITPDKITSPQIATDLLGLFSSTTTHPPVISTANDNLIVDLYGNAVIQVSGTGGMSAPSITAGNTITIQNGTGSPNDVVLSCPTNGTLNVGGNVQADAVGTEALNLQSGASSVSLTNITGIISTNYPIATNSSVSANTFIGGIVSAVWTPASPIACAPGLYTATTCVIPNFPTNIVATSCAFFFQIQSTNAQAGCVPVVVPTYTVVQAGTNLTLGIYFSTAVGSAGAAIENVSILIVNPSYTAIAP